MAVGSRVLFVSLALAAGVAASCAQGSDLSQLAGAGGNVSATATATSGGPTTVSTVAASSSGSGGSPADVASSSSASSGAGGTPGSGPSSSGSGGASSPASSSSSSASSSSGAGGVGGQASSSSSASSSSTSASSSSSSSGAGGAGGGASSSSSASSSASSSSGSVTCAHDLCVTGTKLAAACDPCVTMICAVKASCCSNTWGNGCVNDVSTVCGSSQCGGNACGHSLCSAGNAVDPTCNACANDVCNQDPFCCTFEWDSICVSEADEYCTNMTCP